MPDEQLNIDDLRAKNDARVVRINNSNQGQALSRNPIGYLTTLVQAILDPQVLAEVDYKFESQFSDDLTEVEKQIRINSILQTNGKG